MGTSKILIDGVGIDLTGDTVAANNMLSDTKAHGSNGDSITGTIPSKTAATYTPTTTDQTIATGQYLSGAQTVKGDANLIAANIRSGKSIFGVAGSLTPGITPSGTKNITANGTYDVTEFASAAVNVPYNSKAYNIVLSSDIPTGGLATVVSGDEDIASHAQDTNILIAFRAESLSTNQNAIHCGVMGFKKIVEGYQGYGLRYSTSAGGISFFPPNDLTTNHQGIKLDTSGNMKFMSGATYKFLAGTYTVVISW